MPLAKGASPSAISSNISELIQSGRPRAQAIAAALTTARRARRAEGGAVKTHAGPIHSGVAGRTDHLPMHVDSGSYVLPADIVSAMGEGNTVAGFKIAKKLPNLFSAQNRTKGTPYSAKGLPYGAPAPHRADGGTVDGPDFGSHSELADHLEAKHPGLKLDMSARGDHVSLGRIVVPKDQRNTGVGTTVMKSVVDWADRNGKSMSLTPTSDFGGSKNRLKEFYKRHGFVENKGRQRDYSISDLMLRPRRTKAAGGSTAVVPIVAAGGEHVYSPDEVRQIGGGDLDTGHKILDHFVKQFRAKTVDTLKKLPGPRRD